MLLRNQIVSVNDTIRLPPSLLRAVASRANRITLIVGAGCSVESPTGLKLSKEYSKSIHDELIADGVLDIGECSDPNDLSELASVVYRKTNQQTDVVARLPRNEFRYAKANDGYLLAAALLCEGSISVIATLNYDLALTDAVRQLDGRDVDEIAGPCGLRDLGGKAIIYLHRNVNESDFEKWILRKEALEYEWRGGWESFVSGWITASPVVLFAGLGSLAAVLSETLRKIRNAFPDQIEAFVADPGAQTPFAKSLDLPAENYIQASWGAFMDLLSERVVTSLKEEMVKSCSELCATNQWSDTSESILAVCSAFVADGLVKIGQRRSALLCSDKAYEPDQEGTRLLIADLLLAVGLVAVATSAEISFASGGDATLRFGNGSTITVGLLSGCGHRRWGQIDGLLTNRGTNQLNLVIAGGFAGHQAVDVTPPADLIDIEPEFDIAVGVIPRRVVSVDALRSELSNIIGELV